MNQQQYTNNLFYNALKWHGVSSNSMKIKNFFNFFTAVNDCLGKRLCVIPAIKALFENELCRVADYHCFKQGVKIQYYKCWSLSKKLNSYNTWCIFYTQSCRLRLVVTDGVFSMDGDVAPLVGICDLAEQYGALVFIDECHATGFLGSRGR